jgi:hypothetical protein
MVSLQGFRHYKTLFSYNSLSPKIVLKSELLRVTFILDQCNNRGEKEKKTDMSCPQRAFGAANGALTFHKGRPRPLHVLGIIFISVSPEAFLGGRRGNCNFYIDFFYITLKIINFFINKICYTNRSRVPIKRRAPNIGRG